MHCNICEVGCEINEHSQGRCGTYVGIGNTIVQNPDLGYLGAYPISIETVPFLHYYPSGKFLQVFSTGCNFQCSGCVARMLASSKSLNLSFINPSQVVEKALQQECLGIVSTLNEPAANYYLFRNLAVQAKKKGLLVGCSTNCYFTGETLEEFGQLVDFVNVGIKGYSDGSYCNCGVHASAPVFRNISRLFDLGVHIEASVVYSKGNENDVIQVSKAVSEISSSIPLQVMRFLPLDDAPIELEPSIGETESLCSVLRKDSDFVYLFNSPGTGFLNTYCPKCGSLLAEREFHGPMGSRLLKPWISYTCDCGNFVPVKGAPADESFSEAGFMGGYRISRAFSMVHAVLVCLGILDDYKLMEIWGGIYDTETLMEIHYMIQQPYSYLDFIRLIAEKANVPEKGEELISYIQKRLAIVRNLATENISHKMYDHKVYDHKVYYCMGSPLFALNAGRMENNLVTFSGGISINKQLQKEGKPGVNVSPSFINEYNPDSIFISGFLSRPLDEFYGLCKKYGIYADAVKMQRIYRVPPSWDFGSPRWILGLMYIADKLHSERSTIDLRKEADEFYSQFYGLPFEEAKPNRSFHRPSSGIWPRQVMRCTHA
jgi:pyruvate-formate lyase-activating enzyme